MVLGSRPRGRCRTAVSFAVGATDVGSLGGGEAFANDVNEAGQIVGASLDASGYQRAFLWENGVMTDIGVPPGASAGAINDKGQIVGTMNGGRQGFLWDHGTIT